MDKWEEIMITNLQYNDAGMGLNFMITCARCKLALGTSTVQRNIEMYCEPCGKEHLEHRTSEEIQAMQEKSRKAFTNKLLAQAGLRFRI